MLPRIAPRPVNSASYGRFIAPKIRAQACNPIQRPLDLNHHRVSPDPARFQRRGRGMRLWRGKTGTPSPPGGARARLSLDHDPALTYAVGDVHGCLDLYKSLEAAILKDARQQAPGQPVLIVLLGDLVDRGPDSAAVIDHLLDPPPENTERLCLCGNHEAMMLDFLDDPVPDAGWLSFGGIETLASYGVTPRPAWRRRQFTQAIASHIPPEHIAFLRNLPVSLTIPEYLLVHAGFDVGKPLADQLDRDFLWSNPASLDADHAGPGLRDLMQGGRRLVHGHVPAKTPEIHPDRIATDTGAFATGRLTAVRLMPGKSPDFLTT